MRNAFILLFLFTPLFAKEPSMDISASGLGFLHPAFSQSYALYRSFEDTKPFDTLGIRQNADGTWSYDTATLKLKPYRLYGGNSPEQAERNIRTGGVPIPPALAFRVLQKEGDRFLILLNEETGESAVLKTAYISSLPKGFPLFERNQEALYESWEEYLKRALGVSAKDDRVVIYNLPKGSIIFQHSGYLPYQVYGMDGDYIKVKKAFGQEGWFRGLKNTEGWMRWREGNSPHSGARGNSPHSGARGNSPHSGTRGNSPHSGARGDRLLIKITEYGIK